MFLSMQKGGLHPGIIDKINERHIDKTLQITERANELIHKDKKYIMIFASFCLLLLFSFSAFVIYYLKTDGKEIIFEIIKDVSIALGGFGAGYSYKTYKEK